MPITQDLDPTVVLPEEDTHRVLAAEVFNPRLLAEDDPRDSHPGLLPFLASPGPHAFAVEHELAVLAVNLLRDVDRLPRREAAGVAVHGLDVVLRNPHGWTRVSLGTRRLSTPGTGI